MAPPRYPKFPSLAERQSLMAELQAARQRGDALSTGQHFQNYLNALTALDAKMKQYSEIDETFGLPPTLNEAGKLELLNALTEVAAAGETFLADAQNRIREDPQIENKEAALGTGIPGTVGRVQSLLAQDYDTLRNYKEKETPLSFPELQQLARTKVVDLRGKKIGVMRNKLSDRIPMTVVDLQGRRRPGVFTKASYVDFMPKFRAMLEDAASYYDSESFKRTIGPYRRYLFDHDRPEHCTSMDQITDEQVIEKMKGRVTGVLDKYRAYLIQKNERINGTDPRNAPENMLGVILSQKVANAGSVRNRALLKRKEANELAEQGVTGKELEDAQKAADEAEAEQQELEELMSAVGLNMLELPEDVADKLKDGFKDMALDRTNMVNIYYLGLAENQRYDQRNSAMTAVGSLLGMNHLVARSENMKFLDEEGKEVEGTFMEFADGLDLHGSKGLKDFNKVCDDPFAPPCTALAQIADLQAFDFLCGNVDRHGGNMSYQVDKDGKFTGIKAFDNDTSFGLLPIGKKSGLFRQAGVNDLMVITEDMANKIKSITPEMLKFTLRGRGLTQAEIDRSCERLRELKEAVENSIKGKTLADIKNAKKQKKLCVMKADDLKKIHLNDMPETKYALFHNVKVQLHNRMKEAREANIQFQPGALEREGKKEPSLTEVSTTERKYAAGGIAESMSGMDRMLKNEVTGFEVGGLSKFLHSSGKWRDMISAVKDAAKAAKTIRKLMKKNQEALDRNDPKVKDLLKKADKAMEKARKATDAYLQRKMDEKHVEDPEALRNLGKHQYEQNRMNYALKLRDTIREYDALRNPEPEKNPAAREQDALQNPEPKEDPAAEAAREQLAFAARRREQQPQAGGGLQA